MKFFTPARTIVVLFVFCFFLPSFKYFVFFYFQGTTVVVAATVEAEATMEAPIPTVVVEVEAVVVLTGGQTRGHSCYPCLQIF